MGRQTVDVAGRVPTGTVTFLFTDIESSTRRWVEYGDAMADAVARHDAIVTSEIAAEAGHVFATGGDGFAAAFSDASACLRAAVGIQRRLAVEDFSAVDGLSVRMGLHTGTAEMRHDDYFGPEVARASRIAAAGHGGQILLSAVTAAVVTEPTIELGAHAFRDFPEPQVIHQVPDADAREFPPLRSLHGGRTTLPSPRSTLFGRHSEIERVRRALHTHRLVTLTGVGGTGKTRLAVEAAWEELPNRTGGVFFADLTTATDEAQLVAAIVGATIERADGAADPLSQVLMRIAGLDAVLIFDNCEHLLDESATTVEALLNGCPDLRILATSREPLDVDGEQVIRVTSLAARSPDGAGPGVQLFIDRAHGADPDLDLSDQSDVVAEICDRLDGIPLAIELAAARTRVLRPPEVLARLDDRFRLLTGSRRRRGHQRQKTLEATVSWSYDLLDVDEQRAFRSLAVLEGDFTLDAAGAIADLAGTDAVDMLDSLVAKSLVNKDPETGQFSLLETLRQYAAARLVEAGEADMTRDRHLAYFRDLLPERAPEDEPLHSPESDLRAQATIAVVDATRANLVAALRWATVTDADEALLDIMIRGAFELGYGHPDSVQWYDAAIDRARGMDLARLLYFRMSVALLALDTRTWSRCARRIRELITEDHWLLALTLGMHGFLRTADAPEITIRRCKEATAMAERLGLDPRNLGMLTSQYASGLVGLRRYDEALALMLPSVGSLHSVYETVALTLPPVLHLAGRTDDAIEFIEADHPRTDVWKSSIAGLLAALLVSAGRLDEALPILVEESSRPHINVLALASDALVLGFATARAAMGDGARAAELVEVCAGYRTPGTLAMLVELVARLEAWPDEEFHDRRRAFVMRRFDAAWIARTSVRHGALLAEEAIALSGALRAR